MSSSAETFILKLQEQVSGPSAQATSALSQLEAKIQEEQSALTGLEGKLAEAAAKLQQLSNGSGDGSVNVAAFQKQQAAVAGLQAQVDQTTASIEQLGSAGTKGLAEQADAIAANTAANEAASDAAGGATLNFRAMAGSTRMLGGELGGTASKGLRLVQMFSRMGPEVGLAVVAFIALASVIAGVVGIITKGIEAAGALRDEFLKLQGASKGSATAAHELQSAIASVSSASALSRDKVTGYAMELEKTGLKGAELQRALEAMAIAGSAGGDEVASAFLKSAEAAKATGGSVDALSAKMKKELGGVAAEQALGLSAQFTKLGENITDIFSGADIEPLLKGIRDLLSIFGQGTDSANSMKAAITAMVNYAIGAFLKTAIAVVKLITSIRQSTVASFALKTALYAVLVVLALVVAAVVILGVAALIAWTLFMLPIFIVIGVVLLLWAGIKALWNWLKGITWADVGHAILYAFLIPFAPVILLWTAIKALWNKAKGLSWTDIGNGIKDAFNAALAWMMSLPARFVALAGAIIRGLVSGIKAAGGAVLSALTGVVGSAVDAVKGLLGIHSPSKVFAELGVHTTTGMAQGIDSGADNVASSAGDMAKGAADAGAVSMKSGGKGGAKGSKGGPSFTFTNCVFGEGMSEDKLEAWFLGILERNTLAMEPAS